MSTESSGEKVRLDKWLWAARFFKTRTLAAHAVNGGKVRVNGGRAKAARLVGPGDRLEVHKEGLDFILTVLGVSPRRLSAPAAAALYLEEQAGVEKREELSEMRRALRKASPRPPPGRPGKRDRRLIKKFTRQDES